MKIPHCTCQRIRQQILLHKPVIITSFFALIALIVLATGVEYFAFGHTLRSLDQPDQGKRTVTANDISSEGFITDDRGVLISQSENATIVVHADSRHIENLVIRLAGEPKYDIAVSYTDPVTHLETPATNEVGKRMIKGKFDFLSSISYPVQTSPETVTISAKALGTTISEITVDNTYRFSPYRFAFVLTALIIATVLFALRKKVGTHPEYAFLVVALATGSLFALSELRAYTSWDELIHYQVADNLSLKQIFPKTVNDHYGTNLLPSSYSFEEQSIINDKFDHDYRTKSASKKSSKKSNFNIGTLITFYNQIGHLPSGITLLLGRIIRLPQHIIFVLGQWVNVLVFSTLIFFAIRKLKTGKMILAVTALLPTSIFLASNYGYDSWVTGFIALGLAYFFSALQQPDKKLTKRETIIMIASLVIGCGPKAIYFPFIFLLFLLRPAKFDSKKQYRNFLIATTLAIIFVVGSFALPFLVSNGSGYSDRRGGSGINASEQMHFILSDPVAYTGILFNFLKGYLNPMNAGGFTTFFAYLGSFQGFQILLAIMAIVTLTDRSEYDKKTTNLTRLSIVVAFFASVVLISTALYVSFTPVGSPIINGVQPRYLIPILFPFLFIFGYFRLGIPQKFRSLYYTVIFGVMAFVMLHGIWDLVISLYH